MFQVRPAYCVQVPTGPRHTGASRWPLKQHAIKWRFWDLASLPNVNPDQKRPGTSAAEPPSFTRARQEEKIGHETICGAGCGQPCQSRSKRRDGYASCIQWRRTWASYATFSEVAGISYLGIQLCTATITGSCALGVTARPPCISMVGLVRASGWFRSGAHELFRCDDASALQPGGPVGFSDGLDLNAHVQIHYHVSALDRTHPCRGMPDLWMPDAAPILRKRQEGCDLTARQCRAVDSSGDSPLAATPGKRTNPSDRAARDLRFKLEHCPARTIVAIGPNLR